MFLIISLSINEYSNGLYFIRVASQGSEDVVKKVKLLLKAVISLIVRGDVLLYNNVHNVSL